MAPSTTKLWIMANRPTGLPTYSGPDASFKLVDRELPKLGEDQVLVKPIFLSNDPAQRAWMQDIPADRTYMKPLQPGDVMHAWGLAEIIESTSSTLKPGTIVSGTLSWSEYVVLKAKECAPLPDPPKGLSITQYLGALGITGFTAYYGIVVVGEAKPQHKVVISGAAGATGSMVVQIAKKIVGCNEVIGIAGTDEKCRWVESIGADKCLNYKSPNFKQELNEAGKNADLYFDNVAGEILDEMLGIIRQGGVIIGCGGIQGYNSEPTVLKNFMQMILMRLQYRGFLLSDYMHKRAEMGELLTKAYLEGKLHLSDENETVVPTKFEDIPKTWLKLFEGGNQGKLVTKLA